MWPSAEYQQFTSTEQLSNKRPNTISVQLTSEFFAPNEPRDTHLLILSCMEYTYINS